MMGSRRTTIIVLIAAGALALSILGGCGGSGSDTTSGVKEPSTRTEAATPGSTPPTEAHHASVHGGTSDKGHGPATSKEKHTHSVKTKNPDRIAKAPPTSPTSGGKADTQSHKHTQSQDRIKSHTHTNTQPHSHVSSSSCGSNRKCLERAIYEAEQGGANGGHTVPPDQCPSAMSAAQCESAGKAAEEGGEETATSPDQCPAAMSEAECRALGEAYEASGA